MRPRTAASAGRDVARFDRWAKRYDRSFLQRRVFDPVHRALIRAVGPVDGLRVLDVGCGTGILSLALARSAGRVVGVDPAPRMVAKATEKAGHAPVSFLVASAEALPFADGSFDGATASFTLHHWRDARRGLAELGRVVRPGGSVAIGEFDLPGPLRVLLRLVESPHAGFSRPELASLLYRAGFSRVRALTPGPLGSRSLIIQAHR